MHKGMVAGIVWNLFALWTYSNFVYNLAFIILAKQKLHIK